MKKILLTTALCASMAMADNVLLPVEKRTFDQSKYIPDISLILDASYVNRSKDDDKMKHYKMPGITHAKHGHDDHGHNHAGYNEKNGFNLNYGELVLSSNVDPYFSMEGVFHLSQEGFEIEELYFTSTALENGLRFKGGKFLSNFGYLNEQHHHVWDFADMPIVYEGFFGSHGINEIGAQLQWTAPTPFYLLAGVEVLQGDNEQMFGNGSIEVGGNNIAEIAKAPSLYIAYLKSSFDIGDTTILGGLSYAYGKTRINHKDHGFTGSSSVYGADFVVKHYFDSYSYLKFQNEYLYRDMDGTHFHYDASSIPQLDLDAQTKKQAGFYSQLVYAHNQNWRAGARYEAISTNDISTAPNIAKNMDKYSAMIEYNTSEFARFRLQYNRDNSLYDGAEQQHIDTIILQANISIGAHAAHAF